MTSYFQGEKPFVGLISAALSGPANVIFYQETFFGGGARARFPNSGW